MSDPTLQSGNVPSGFIRCQQEIQSLTQLPSTMEINDGEEEEFEFSRNYFLAKELAGSGARAASANIEPKHEKEINLDCMS
ncbi:hypothetical protein DKX38_011016 [Salix brachista]|uniref:Uncharacterized protein n=1 Tax=Salix brachista TaxID=2182728 RepID=A0A5N5LY33_9ROSI|nr:hypothetical protein DKX38_011016 [Salix brachista]